MTTRTEVEAWVERYVEAWDTNTAEAIGALFSDDARYFTAPYREPWTGRDAIVDGWLDRRDEPGTWRFTWRVLGVDGDLGFVRGMTTYPDAAFSNLWVVRLRSDGRASEFVEWWMEVESS